MIKVNEYFNGKVKSIGFNTKDCPATVGVMEKGEYEFGTSSIEIMTVISGKLIVRLPDTDVWKDFVKNETFTVQAGKKFQLKVNEDSSYLCLYK